jgi:hypothetical protein
MNKRRGLGSAFYLFSPNILAIDKVIQIVNRKP